MLDSITTLPHATQPQAEFNTMRYDEYSPLGEPDFPPFASAPRGHRLSWQASWLALIASGKGYILVISHAM